MGRARLVQVGQDVLLVTFGNGVRLSMRAARRLADGSRSAAPSSTCSGSRRSPWTTSWRPAGRHPGVVVVDETRSSGGVSEGVVAALVDAGYAGRTARVTSADTFIPLGPAADHVLLSEDELVRCVQALVSEPT